MTAVVDAGERLLGVFTDGDLRRTLDDRADIHATVIDDVMIRECKTVRPEMLAVSAVEMLDRYRITSLPVVDDEQRLVGALNVHDLLRSGVM
jgi:arabinose-5-phosphate isomerase